MIRFTTMEGHIAAGAAAVELLVPNMNGSLCHAPMGFVQQFADASARWMSPLAILLVQCAQESAFNAQVQSSDGGYGLGQWTYEPVARQYLGVPSGDWHPAALDPARSIEGTAHFMHDLYDQMASWLAALEGYNGGPSGPTIPSAAQYGEKIMAQARAFEPRMIQAFGVAHAGLATKYVVTRLMKARTAPNKAAIKEPVQWLNKNATLDGTGRIENGWVEVVAGGHPVWALLSNMRAV